MYSKSNLNFVIVIVLSIVYFLLSGFIQPSQCMDLSKTTVSSLKDDSSKASKHDKDLKSTMHDMDKDIRKVKMTGNPDADFAKIMTKYHQGAIDLSKDETKHGNNKELKTFANKEIDNQKNDIKALKDFTKKSNTSNKSKNEMTGGGVSGTAEKDMMKSVDDVMGNVDNMNMTGNVDKDYASLMITHYQGANDIAEKYLDNGKDQKLKDLANNMIKDNKSKIDQLKDWQSKNK